MNDFLIFVLSLAAVSGMALGLLVLFVVLVNGDDFCE